MKNFLKGKENGTMNPISPLPALTTINSWPLLLHLYKLVFNLSFVTIRLLPRAPQLACNYYQLFSFEKPPTQKVEVLSQNTTFDMGAAA